MRQSFTTRAVKWATACFGDAAFNLEERNHRFLEEALELVQATGCTAYEAHQLVDYVFGRPVGETKQEVGGVMNTLALLAALHGVDIEIAADDELDRCWAKLEAIREKQRRKPKHSPLPGAS